MRTKTGERKPDALEALACELDLTRSSREIFRSLELVVGGVWLGTYIILHLLGYMGLLVAKPKGGAKTNPND